MDFDLLYSLHKAIKASLLTADNLAYRPLKTF